MKCSVYLSHRIVSVLEINSRERGFSYLHSLLYYQDSRTIDKIIQRNIVHGRAQTFVTVKFKQKFTLRLSICIGSFLVREWRCNVGSIVFKGTFSFIILALINLFRCLVRTCRAEGSNVL